MNPALSLVLQSIQKVVDIDEQAFVESQQRLPHTSIKINPYKIHHTDALDIPLDTPVMWAQDAYYCKERPAFYLDPLFYAGAYYVMDASSMFLEYILKYLNISPASIILDIAAAPGGKSVIISNYLNEEGLLWSNDAHHNRCKTLVYNLNKWGKFNFVVTNNSAEKFSMLQEVFDVVLCDAPCTGSGLFRKYPQWMKAFNEHWIHQCQSQQKQILDSIFPTIKKDGYLIYSTCSFTAEEDEYISEFILKNGFDYVDIAIDINSGIVKTNRGLRFFPHLTKSEGFFYAVFQKKEIINKHTASARSSIYPRYLPELADKRKVHTLKYLAIQDTYNVYHWQNQYYLSHHHLRQYFYNFKYLSIGTPIGHSSLALPTPEMALSIYLHPNIQKIELQKKDALQYLKKENIPLNIDKDIYLVTHQHIGLGWIKVLENRINNYYPTEWRILKDVQ